MAEPQFINIQNPAQAPSIRPSLPSTAPTLDIRGLKFSSRDRATVAATKATMEGNLSSALRTLAVDPSLRSLINKEKIEIIADMAVPQARFGRSLDGRHSLRLNPMILLNEIHTTRSMLFFVSAIEAGRTLGRDLPGEGKQAIEFGLETDKNLARHQAAISRALIGSPNSQDRAIGQALSPSGNRPKLQPVVPAKPKGRAGIA